MDQPADGAAAAELLRLSRCRRCGAAAYPVKRYCPTCGSRDLVGEPLPKDAEIFAYTRIPEEGHDRWVALVNAGDVRVMAALMTGTASPAIGDRVQLKVGSSSLYATLQP